MRTSKSMLLLAVFVLGTTAVTKPALAVFPDPIFDAIHDIIVSIFKSDDSDKPPYKGEDLKTAKSFAQSMRFEPGAQHPSDTPGYSAIVSKTPRGELYLQSLDAKTKWIQADAAVRSAERQADSARTMESNVRALTGAENGSATIAVKNADATLAKASNEAQQAWVRFDVLRRLNKRAGAIRDTDYERIKAPE